MTQEEALKKFLTLKQENPNAPVDRFLVNAADSMTPQMFETPAITLVEANIEEYLYGIDTPIIPDHMVIASKDNGIRHLATYLDKHNIEYIDDTKIRDGEIINVTAGVPLLTELWNAEKWTKRIVLYYELNDEDE